jgi:lipoprotein NlpI
MRAGKLALTAALAAAALLNSALCPAATPLLALAESKHYLRAADDLRHQGAVLASYSMLDALYQRYGENGACESGPCKQRLVEILRELGLGYSQLDMHLLSLNYYQAVLHLADDQPTSHADVGSELMLLGRLDEAGAEFAKAVAMADGKDGEVEYYAGSYHLVADRPAKAREQFVACAKIPDGPPRQLQYCALGLALTKLRGSDGDDTPQVAASDEWPGPVLRYLRGESDEAALTHAIETTEEAAQRRERLSEALYYAGESYLYHDDKPTALRYFRANTALKVEGFLETLLSKRRIEQLHGNDDAPPHTPPPSHIPIS